MLSDAGRQYATTKAVNPFNTMQRFRYYQHEPVKSQRKQAKPYHTIDTNLRDKHDSFFLRYAKQIVVNTNHSPNHSLVSTTEKRQIIPKAKFQRYIGDVRGEDFSVPLNKNCNHRCAKANNVTFDLGTTTTSKNTNNSFMNQGQNPLSTLQNPQNNQNIENKVGRSVKISKQISNQLKSTQPSLIKKRSNATIELSQKQERKPKAIKGVPFKSSSGHQYLKEVDDKLAKEKMPQFYDLSSARESVIKNSFREPRINVDFGTFRDKVATRYDRSDPDWHLRMDTSNQHIQDKDMSYDFCHYSDRKINEVKSKYPHRASMNLYMFPAKGNKLPQL